MYDVVDFLMTSFQSLCNKKEQHINIVATLCKNLEKKMPVIQMIKMET